MLIFELLITIFYFKFSINTWWEYRNIYRTINHLCNFTIFFISKLFLYKTNFSIDKNEKVLDVWKFLISIISEDWKVYSLSSWNYVTHNLAPKNYWILQDGGGGEFCLNITEHKIYY